MVSLEPALVGLHGVVHRGVDQRGVQQPGWTRPVCRYGDRCHLPLHTDERDRVPVRHDAGLCRRHPLVAKAPSRAMRIFGFMYSSPDSCV